MDEPTLSRVIAVEWILAGFLLNSDTVDLMLGSVGATRGFAAQILVLAVQFTCIVVGLSHLLKGRKRTASKVLLAAFSTGVCALFNVVFIQLFYHPPVIGAGWGSTGAREEINQFSSRGRKVEYQPEDKVILLVGDSQVESVASPFDQMPERQLEHHLQSQGISARVFSLGVQGYGQDQELLMLEQYFRSNRADVVALWQTPGNDIWNNIFPTHWPDNGYPKPTFWLEDGQLRGPNYQMGELVDYSPIKVVTLWRRAIRKSKLKLDDLWETHLPEPYSPIQEYDGPVNQSWEELEDTTLGNENLVTEKSHLAIYLTPPSPRMEYGIQLTHLLLAKIQDLVHSHGGKLVLFETVTEHDYLGPGEQVYPFKGPLYRASAEQSERTMARVNEGFTSWTLPVTVKEWRVSKRDPHLNIEANNQVMGDLAKHLQPLLKPGGTAQEARP